MNKTKIFVLGCLFIMWLAWAVSMVKSEAWMMLDLYILSAAVGVVFGCNIFEKNKKE